jgi:hypothetical protein
VVRALRITYDRDDLRCSEDVDVIDPAPKPTTRTPDAVAVQARIGIRDCREVALNLAGVRGLGLLGPGATAAARALVLHLLAERSGAIRILVPATDLGPPVRRCPQQKPAPHRRGG